VQGSVWKNDSVGTAGLTLSGPKACIEGAVQRKNQLA
jgi:hypothetical protein